MPVDPKAVGVSLPRPVFTCFCFLFFACLSSQMDIKEILLFKHALKRWVCPGLFAIVGILGIFLLCGEDSVVRVLVCL